MWRILRDIPKSFRGQNCAPRTNPTPQQTWALEEENQKQERRASQDTDYHSLLSLLRSSRQYQLRAHERKCQEGFWKKYQQTFSNSRGGLCHSEALAFGAAVLCGIHLTKILARDLKDSENKKDEYCLYKGAFNLPGLLGTSMQAMGNETKKKKRTKKLTQLSIDGTPSQLEEVCNEFSSLSDKYTSMAHNLAGIFHATKGKFSEAVKYWETSAAKTDYAKAHYNLGVAYENGVGSERNLTKAASHYQNAASKGHAMASYNLAMLHLLEKDGLKKDTQKAMNLLEMAAMQGLTKAQLHLGVCYTEEETRDMKRAAELFQLAADKHDKFAQYYLGICYENGLGVDQNECKAADLYSQAAQAGHEGAQYNLGVFFEHGYGGLPVDQSSAKNLYHRACEAGNQDACYNLQRMYTLEALNLITGKLAERSTSPNNNRRTSFHTSSSSPSLSSSPTSTEIKSLWDDMETHSNHHLDNLSLSTSDLTTNKTSFYIGDDSEENNENSVPKSFANTAYLGLTRNGNSQDFNCVDVT